MIWWRRTRYLPDLPCSLNRVVLAANVTASCFPVSCSRTRNHVVHADLATRHMKTRFSRFANINTQFGSFHESFNSKHASCMSRKRTWLSRLSANCNIKYQHYWQHSSFSTDEARTFHFSFFNCNFSSVLLSYFRLSICLQYNCIL